MKKQRILKLAAYMEKVDADKYYQGSWLEFEGHLTDDQVSVRALPRAVTAQPYHRVTIKEGACNTTSCVLGHGIAALPEARLFWAAEDADVYTDEKGRHEISGVTVGLVHLGGLYHGFEAGAVALGISVAHAEVIFGGGGRNTDTQHFYTGQRETSTPATPLQVALALRNYVATNGKSVDDILGRY